MIGSAGDMRVFWSNSLVGSITTLALVLLFWPLISAAFDRVRRSPAPRSWPATSSAPAPATSPR